MKFDDYNYSSLNQMIFKMPKYPNAAENNENQDENGDEKIKDFMNDEKGPSDQ